MKTIILASASERRSRILSECGIKHKVVPGAVEEGPDVLENAVKKAENAAGRFKDAIIIGADTLVVHDGDILGKPNSEDTAKEMLARFSGSEVEVYTGLCVIDTGTGKKASGAEKSSLSVHELADERIDKYFKLLAPYDKAGGFSIEGVGSLVFDDIRGSYFNILGLPMTKLAELFGEIGEDILDYVDTRHKTQDTRRQT